MKKSITPYLILSIAAGLALTLSSSAFAADDNPNDPKADKKATPATAAKAPAHTVQHQTVNKNVNTAASHTVVSHTAANTPVVQSHGTRTAGTNTSTSTNTNRTRTALVSTGGNGGGQYTRANNYGGRWTAGNNHPNWNQGQMNDWNGHQYRWYDGGWLMVDGGFWPVPVYQGGGSMMAGAQQQLATDGYYHGPIDGIAGPGTRQAIASYQNANNLPVTGHLNIPTQQSLGLD